MEKLIRKVLLQETNRDKLLKDEVTEYVYSLLTKHSYDDAVGDSGQEMRQEIVFEVPRAT
jgi:hypothetical protein